MIALLQRIRRNHAIEHATLHMLARSTARVRLLGQSDAGGITFYGDADDAQLRQALDQGLRALQAGAAELAVHPRCGSGVTVTGLLALVPAWVLLTELERRRPSLRVPLALLGLVSAAVLAPPLALTAQACVFTEAEVASARILSLTRYQFGDLSVRRVDIGYD